MISQPVQPEFKAEAKREGTKLGLAKKGALSLSLHPSPSFLCGDHDERAEAGREEKGKIRLLHFGIVGRTERRTNHAKGTAQSEKLSAPPRKRRASAFIPGQNPKNIFFRARRQFIFAINLHIVFNVDGSF